MKTELTWEKFIIYDTEDAKNPLMDSASTEADALKTSKESANGILANDKTTKLVELGIYKLVKIVQVKREVTTNIISVK